MTDEEAESARLTLIKVLSDAEELLQRYSVKHWPVILEQSRKLIQDRDIRGIKMLISIFGAMGSFNDVVIHPLNGNPIAPGDVTVVNDKFQSLKGKIYELTDALRHYDRA